MKQTLSILLAMFLMISCTAAAFADQTYKNPVCELYSVDGYYEDDVGNAGTYSFHIPQIHDATADAEEINAEIVEQFVPYVEAQFQNMEKGCSLWSKKTDWEAYWSGNQLFLLITSYLDGDCIDYGAYGYDFDTGTRVTNEMILKQRGISEQEYLENLREKVLFMFEDMYRPAPAGMKTETDHDQLLKQTMSWLDMENPMFINQFGEIVTIVKIASVAGAGQYYYLATPFVYG